MSKGSILLAQFILIHKYIAAPVLGVYKENVECLTC